MAVVGTVHLLAFGFDSQYSVAPSVLDRAHRVTERGVIRLLDVLLVSRDAQGRLELHHDGGDLDLGSDPPGSTLWQLLGGNGFDTSPSVPLELHSSCETGLDLASVEGLAYRIEPDTTALLVLVETPWATALLDEVVSAGGYPIVVGCLEPETMLVVGPQLAAAADARASKEAVAAAHGAAALDTLSAAPETSSTIAADMIRALVVACIIDPTDVDDTISALAHAGLVSSSPEARADGRK